MKVVIKNKIKDNTCRVKYMTGEIACVHRGKEKPEKESEVIAEDDSFERRIIDLRTLAQSFWCNDHGLQTSWLMSKK